MQSGGSHLKLLGFPLKWIADPGQARALLSFMPDPTAGRDIDPSLGIPFACRIPFAWKLSASEFGREKHGDKAKRLKYSFSVLMPAEGHKSLL